MPYDPRPLPVEVQQLIADLKAPSRLVAHLMIVHDTAAVLVGHLQERIPQLILDEKLMLFGAATHDLGKARHTNELTGPGRQHEIDGPTILEGIGVQPQFPVGSRTI